MSSLKEVATMENYNRKSVTRIERVRGTWYILAKLENKFVLCVRYLADLRLKPPPQTVIYFGMTSKRAENCLSTTTANKVDGVG